MLRIPHRIGQYGDSRDGKSVIAVHEQWIPDPGLRLWRYFSNLQNVYVIDDEGNRNQKKRRPLRPNVSIEQERDRSDNHTGIP